MASGTRQGAPEGLDPRNVGLGRRDAARNAESPLPIGVVDHPSFEAHHAGEPHPERPERLAAARSGLEAAVPPEARVVLEAPLATETDLARAHDRAHLSRLLARLQSTSGHDRIDADTFVSPGSHEAALRAAGGAAAMARALMAGEVSRGIALVRPPGHHAEPDRAMGFCLLNNVAVAAGAAIDAGARKVAIVDWDVHHGNGTQEAFYRDPQVLFISLHQWPLYPGTGAPTEIGAGAGLGTNANLALPAGSGPDEYAHAFRALVLPLLDGFAPDLVLVSAGYDAHVADPLASMGLDDLTYGALTSSLVELVERLGHGRLGLVLEGGYDLRALEGSVKETVRAATGARTPLPEGRPSRIARGAIDVTVRALARYHPAIPA